MATKKQRRRREKLQRHEYEYVVETEEGEEVVVDRPPPSRTPDAAPGQKNLPPGALVRLLELAARKLRPGGLLVAETINPLSPIALRSYFADLTHAQPLVPETLALLAQQSGFKQVTTRFLNEPDKLVEPDDPVLAENTRRLNELLFCPLDYAILART